MSALPRVPGEPSGSPTVPPRMHAGLREARGRDGAGGVPATPTTSSPRTAPGSAESPAPQPPGLPKTPRKQQVAWLRDAARTHARHLPRTEPTSPRAAGRPEGGRVVEGHHSPLGAKALSLGQRVDCAPGQGGRRFLSDPALRCPELSLTASLSHGGAERCTRRQVPLSPSRLPSDPLKDAPMPDLSRGH